MKIKLNFEILSIILFLTMIPITYSYNVCAVYFTGIGCPHCAKADPIVLNNLTQKYSNEPKFIVIEYEIYHDSNYNAQVYNQYLDKYKMQSGVPSILFESGNILGDRPIIENIENVILGGPQPCQLLSGSKDFSQINISSLPGKPKIWIGDMVLIRNPNEVSNEDEVRDVLHGNYKKYEKVKPEPVPLSGRNVYFKNAVKIKGWTVEWGNESSSMNKINYKTILLGIIIVVFLIFLLSFYSQRG